MPSHTDSDSGPHFADIATGYSPAPAVSWNSQNAALAGSLASKVERVKCTQGAKAATRGRKPRDRRGREWPKIPIVNEHLKIVAWSDEAPKIIGCTLRHRRAETLLHQRVSTRIIEIEGAYSELAGAPPNWRGPWRCLAITPDKMLKEPNHLEE